jgi:hypothetical protein
MGPSPRPGEPSAGSDPAVLLKLVKDSGESFAVIEDSVAVLKRSIPKVDLADPAISELLQCHLRAVGSETAVNKFFSFELLARIDEAGAARVCLEVCRMLAGIELIPGRGYPIEREMLRYIGRKSLMEALPPLSVIAAKQAGDISRTAAGISVALLKSRSREGMREQLERLDLPEAAQPAEMADAIFKALTSPRQGQLSGPSATEVVLRSSLAAETSALSLRPERRQERENRLKAILRDHSRNPNNCGNCGESGRTRVAHVIPIERGGSDRPGNLIVLCQQCFRLFDASRQDSSGMRRRFEELSSRQLSLFMDNKALPARAERRR